VLSFAMVALFTACAVGPNFKVPPTPNPTSYGKQPLPADTVATPTAGGTAQHFVVGAAVPSQWWRLFGSPALNRLVAQALEGNPSVASAQAALRQAESNLSSQRGALFPSLQADNSATREKLNGASEGVPQLGTFMYNLFNTSIKLSYTLDVFGGVRRGIEAEAASRDYQRYQLAATYQTLVANVVTTAFRAASIRAQISATEALIEAARRSLELTQMQQSLGGAANPEVQLEQFNLSDIEATLPPLQQQLAVTESQLATYLNKLPNEDLGASLDLDALHLPEDIPVSLPSTMVSQRPDIQQATAQLHRASAEVGVATANMLPQFNINGNVGFTSTSLSNLLSGNVWSLAGGLTQPLFKGGALAAKRRAASAAYDESLAQYRQAVLGAFKNVADTLNALDNDARALSAQHAAQAAAATGLQLTEQRNDLGGANFVEKLTAQRQYQRARVAYVRVLETRYEDTAALFQALGGDWREASRPPAQPTEGTPQ
jgi:NodT family efflux transporter outer membrane factor (OMF) lipoprotein